MQDEIAELQKIQDEQEKILQTINEEQSLTV